jgi:hypothetical protein
VITQPATIKSSDDLWVVLELPKCIVVITREQFVQGLRRGKWFKRHESMSRRLGSVGMATEGQ